MYLKESKEMQIVSEDEDVSEITAPAWSDLALRLRPCSPAAAGEVTVTAALEDAFHVRVAPEGRVRA